MPKRRGKQPQAGSARSSVPERSSEAESSQRGYYRFPSIHEDRIVFASDDDLWIVDAAGGPARRLTAGRSAASRALFSPDGRWLAFAAMEEGSSEAYFMPSEGGEPRRLTFLGAQTYPAAWSRDGAEVVCASDAGRPFLADHHLLAVAVETGRHRPLRVGPARAIAFQTGGPGMAIARNGGDPARWKRYRGGTVGTLWVDLRGRGDFVQILKNLKGNLASPMWIEDRLYFLSDHEGIGNVYSVRPDGRGPLARHTHHEEFYARFPATDGRRIVYHAGADLYLFDSRTGEDRLVPVEIRSPRPQRQRKFVSGGEIEDCDPHPAGHSLLIEVRGRPLTMGLWEGPVTEFGVPWRGRHRLARWLNDGRRIVAATDEEGEEQLEIFTPGQGVRKIPLAQDLGRLIDLVVAPAPPPSKKEARARRKTKRRAAKEPAPAPDVIAVTNQRQEIFVVDLTRREARRIDHSAFDRIAGLSWSPDGRWLAYGLAVGRRHKAIRIAEASTGEHHQITSGDFIDFSPCFDPEGKYLYFLSLRTYDPVYDLIQFGLGFPRGVRPYLVTLKADERSPFMPVPRPLGQAKESKFLGRNPWEILPECAREGGPHGEEKGGEKGPHATEIDFDGIAERVLAFPLGEGRYRQIGAAPGRVFLLADPIEGSLALSWLPGTPPAKASIEVYDLRELKSAVLVSGVSNFAISRDQKTLIYQAGSRLRAILAATEPGKAPAEEKPGRASGWIDLGRARCSVSPVQEWRQMLAEIWRLQRDHFWVPDMSRVDWQRVYARYLPLVERVSTRGEFSDLVWEMQGELGTSHAYEIGGDYRQPPSYPLGFLGADLAFDEREGVWRIAHIPSGDPWDPKQSSPLAAPGLGVRAGMRIHAVNGIPVGRDRSPMECLVHLAGQEVWLTVSAPSAGRGGRKKGQPAAVRSITVKTLAGEHALRYRDWVRSNRDLVHRMSAGRLGYVHIPNMGPAGYAEFHRYFLAEVDRPGLIIDVRHNGGGHVSQLLLDKLLRKRVGFEYGRYTGPGPYPSEAPRGPMVALTDEMAGSDGDIFSHCWKLYKLGPLVGKRTWGGVIGIWPRHVLVDGTVTTQPEFSFWFQDVGWGVENYGTDPDIEVDFRPQDHAAGADPQLDRAVREALRLVARTHEKLPDLKARPRLALPKLPRAPAARRGKR
jgi:tricorn protease